MFISLFVAIWGWGRRLFCHHSIVDVVIGFPIVPDPLVSSLTYPDGYSPSHGTPEFDGSDNTLLVMEVQCQTVAGRIPTSLTLYWTTLFHSCLRSTPKGSGSKLWQDWSRRRCNNNILLPSFSLPFINHFVNSHASHAPLSVNSLVYFN